MKTRSNMPLFVLECDNVKTLSNSQIDLLRCGDYLVKKDASGEHAYKVTFKSATGMCITYHDASVIETQSYDKVGNNWVYNSEDKTELPVNEGDLVVDDLEVTGDAKLFENIVDKDGHKRFIEGDITLEEFTGLTISFAKWSLSGTHLMIVIAGEFAENSTFTAGSILGTCDLPQWILDKIYPVISTYIDSKNVLFRDENWTTQEISTTLIKEANKLRVYLNSTATITSDKGFRINYDLLIDNE